MKNKLNILFPVGSLFPDESGGVSLSLYWLLKGLHNIENINLITITTTYGISEGKIKENIWIDTDYGKVIYLKNKYHKLGFSIIKMFLKQVKYVDIVHLSSIFYPPSFICFFIAKYYKKKIIWSTHGSLDDVEFNKRGFLKKIILFFLRFFCKKTFFHVTSDKEVEFVQKRFGSKIKTVKITNYIVIPEKIESNNEPFFLFIGRFHPKKGIENLLNALKKSQLFIDSSFTLKIAGDYQSEYGNSILKLSKALGLEKKVEFLGHVDGLAKQHLLSRAHFLFMPSFSENFGIVAAEALSQGTPVVASFYTPWQNLETYRAGFWTDNTPVALEEIITKIILMPNEMYLTLVENTSILVKKELDINTNINKWLNFYQAVNNV